MEIKIEIKELKIEDDFSLTGKWEAVTAAGDEARWAITTTLIDQVVQLELDRDIKVDGIDLFNSAGDEALDDVTEGSFRASIKTHD